MTPPPRGIVRITDSRWRVRLMRGGKWHSGGIHPTAADACIALQDLTDKLGPAVYRKPRYPSWRKELARQKAGIPFADMRCIYATPHGWKVCFTRNRDSVYVGHFPKLTTAIAARDRAVDHLPAPARAGRKNKTQLP